MSFISITACVYMVYSKYIDKYIDQKTKSIILFRRKLPPTEYYIYIIKYHCPIRGILVLNNSYTILIFININFLLIFY